MAEPTRSIGIITSRRSKTGATIKEAVRQLGHRAIQIAPLDTLLESRNNTLKDNTDADVILNWQNISGEQYGRRWMGIIAGLEETNTVVNPAHGAFLAGHKPSGLFKLANNGINVPDTILSVDGEKLEDEAKRWPKLVQKPVFGGGGSDVTQVEDDTLNLLQGPEHGLLQSHIDTGDEIHNDVRAFVVGGVVVEAMQRNAPDDDWRTNISTGGEGTQINLSTDAIRTAEQAVSELDLSIAGVDLIQDETGEWYVLEVNAPAGFAGLHDATGVNVGAYIAAYLIQCAGGTVTTDEIRDLATTLEMQTPPEVHSERVFSLKDGEEYQIGGKDGVKTIEIEINPAFEGNALDLEVAADIGVGPVKGTGTSPIPGDDSVTPKVVTWVKLQGHAYHSTYHLVDLSEYDADYVTNREYVVTSRGMSLPGESTGEGE